MSAAASSAVVAAAAAKRRQEQQEEEEMTSYTSRELEDNWEFKIVRIISFSGFKNQDKLRQVLAEEAKNGWEFLEKFDDARIRLKRKRQKGDVSAPGTDPYKTNYGPSQEAVILVVFGITVLVLFCIIMMAVAFNT